MRIADRLREVLRMTTRRDPEVTDQVRQAAQAVRTNSRLVREVRAIQGQLERSRPSLHQQGDASWHSKGSSQS